jgi:hypothetical protein
MNISRVADRYRAVSMELTADLDARNVEMHILTDTGKTIAIVCARDSIFAVQRHIERMGNACPEIATWSDDYRAKLNSGEVLPSFPQHDRLKEGASGASLSSW